MEAPQLAGGFDDILGRNMDGVARLVLRHERRSQFRYLVLLEITLFVFLFIIIVPILILMLLFGNDNVYIDFGDWRGRFWNRWHELRLTVLGQQGAPLAEVRHRPASQFEGEGIVADVLAAAQREGVVVVELLVGDQGGAGEVLEVWYGGRPLLANPDDRPEAQATALLQQAGYAIEDQSDAVVIREPFKRRGRLLAGFIFFCFGLPLSPLLLLAESGRAMLRELLLDIRGVAPAEQVLVLRAESIQTYVERAGKRRDERLVDGADLLGITYSATLGYDKEVTRRVATLRLVGASGSVTVPFKRAAESGRALRDLLVAATQRLRAAKPELGLLGPGPRPTRCPYCTALYDMQPGSRCPNCAAPAGSVD